MVRSLLDRGVGLDPGKVALVCDARRLTYGEIGASTERIAAGLGELGVRRGDRVASCLENGVEAVLTLFGVLKAGAVFVPIGRTAKAQKLTRILDDCGAVAIFADRRVRPVVDEALSGSPGVKTLVLVGEQDATPAPGGIAAVRFESLLASAGATPSSGIDLDLAALIYTSGSSGHPKGVMLTHANILAAVTSINGYLENTADDVILDVLPLSFDYGLYQVFLAFASGARLILERAFAYPAALLELAQREGVTALPIVPTLAALLVRHDLGAYNLSSLRYITNTGAALPPAHIKTLRQALPHARVFSMYGLTECKRVSYLAPEEIDSRPDSVGKPMDNVEVFVDDGHGRLSPTGTGELVIRGSNVMPGYWGAPGTSAGVLRPGLLPGQSLLYSGDRFRIDEAGYMYFEGRLDDMIKSRGQRVSPKEVENVLYELDGVTAAVVDGVPDDVLGTAVRARLTLDPIVTLSEADVLRHCAERLEDFMVPRDVEFVRSLPRTESGKIIRRPLIDESRTETAN
jgi:amino acid adenylation domain-containing protein